MVWPGQMATISNVIFVGKFDLTLEKPNPSPICGSRIIISIMSTVSFFVGNEDSHLRSQ